MKKTTVSAFPALFLTLIGSLSLLTAPGQLMAQDATLDTDLEYQPGPFQPDWDSLAKQYKTPDWFRDAKFGIWAHWGVQCVPESGDWCARLTYRPEFPPNNWQTKKGIAVRKIHEEKYGHPSRVGFKDVCKDFSASKWDPEKLVALYKKTGARYFVAMANHHDNFDNWNSTYQQWNSVNVGPKKDLIELWAKAAKNNDLPFGVSIHAARAWEWYEPAFGSDREGPQKGVPYDGNLTKADGEGKWWEGLDPQEFYTRPHEPGAKPDQAYIDKFFLRTKELIDNYRPDLVYFDDHHAPLENVGLKLYSHFYNSNIRWHEGKLEAVINSKGNDERGSRALVEDVERGTKEGLQQRPWQTDTCIGNWHYRANQSYKKPAKVVRMLVDIVSKNGNLLLNVPLKGDGSPDAEALVTLDGIGKWMAVNSDAIYGTRPWKVFGEGPPIAAGFAQENKARKYTAKDIRFTTKGGKLFVFCLVKPTGSVAVKSLGIDSEVAAGTIASVGLVGSDETLKWKQGSAALTIEPATNYPSDHCVCYEVTFK